MTKQAPDAVKQAVLTLDAKAGAVALGYAKGKKPVWTGALQVEVDGAWAKLKFEPAGADGLVASAGGVTIEVSQQATDGGLAQIGLKLTTAGTVKIGRLVLSIDVPEMKAGRGFMVLKSGLPAMGGAWKVKEGADGLESEASNLVGVLGAQGASPCLLFGSTGVAGDPSYFKVEGWKLLAGFDISRNVTGEFVYGLRFGAGDCEFALLEAFGDSFKDVARKPCKTPTGWNSWDFYGGGGSMKDYKAEMKAINGSELKGKKLKYFSLDMGWETIWGVWRPNPFFPRSFKVIADTIKKEGFTPGIWTSPLQVGRFTHLCRMRQDLFLRYSNGETIFDTAETPVGHVMLLDYSKDEVCEMVSGWFREMREAGFELFKVDYIYAGFLNYLPKTDVKIGKVEFARRIMQCVRDGAGKDAHVVSCGAPPESVIGIADSARVSSDIHNFWGHTVNSARQVSLRTWMDKRLWRIDPDFAIVRSKENCNSQWMNFPYNPRPMVGDDFWMAGPEASEQEMTVWLSLVRLVGGSTILSDSIARLNPGAIKLLAKLYPPLEETGRPVDLFESSIARVWHNADAKRPTVGFFNWDDSAQKVTVPAGLKLPKEGKDFWTGKKVVIGKEVALGGRSALVVEY
jgi:hypothetical protein